VLIETEIAGQRASDKGRHAIAARLSALEAELQRHVRVPHETRALAEAMRSAEAELLLVLTGSATSDASDVAPDAIRRAGGTVTRFGMPVDPGNLLVLGEQAGRPVIGLPGCARSPALNGADWVLSRIVCNLPVTDDDIAAMGVGGLLKESPVRGRPRES
jgi:molybdenum cofactor cytidylyltransferase